MAFMLMSPPVVGALTAKPAAPQRNLIAQSENLGAWGANGAVITGPLGLNALEQFEGFAIASNGNPWHRARALETTATNGDVFSFRLFVRAGSSGKLRIVLWYPATHRGDTFSGPLADMPAHQNGIDLVSNTLHPDGLTRELVLRATVTETGPVEFGLSASSHVAGEDVIVLAAQIETGATASAYQKTPL